MNDTLHAPAPPPEEAADWYSFPVPASVFQPLDGIQVSGISSLSSPSNERHPAASASISPRTE
jgi:hypothetical protein